MNTQGIEKGLEKDSKAVVQSDMVSGVTTDSSDSPNRSSHGRLDCVPFFLFFSSYSSSTPSVHWRGLVDMLGFVITVVLVE